MTEGQEIRLAMIGMIEGNGHPYSWSAIVNGYDPAEMAKCPYAAIPNYLGRQPLEKVRIPGARVTHIWTDDPADAPKVAKASLIANVVGKPEDVIGQVDAVVISTDDGNDHVRRARPFIEAGLPVFVDKPLATNIADLRQFVRWKNEGRILLSTSGMRYSPEMRLSDEQRAHLGDLRWITSLTCKTWERYGIHALEAVYPLLGPGFISAKNQHQPGSDIVHLRHQSGAQVTLSAIHDAYGSFGAVHLHGTKGDLALKLTDTYNAFRSQLVAFIEMLRTGKLPLESGATFQVAHHGGQAGSLPRFFSQTTELMAIIIAGIRSREANGGEIFIRDVLAEVG